MLAKDEDHFMIIMVSLAVSMIPATFLYLIRFDTSKRNDIFFKLMITFAAGGMLGDAFLHIIPHALAGHSHVSQDNQNLHSHHDHDHSHHLHDHSHHLHDHSHHVHDHAHQQHTHNHNFEMKTGLYVLIGMGIFMVLEIIVRIIKDTSDRKRFKQLKKKELSTAGCTISSAAILNLIADFLHNFTDGLAIGSSFNVSKEVGFGSSFMILLHEFPHQVGDFSVLVQSGISKHKAILLQFLTALGGPFGTFLAIHVEEFVKDSSQYALPITAGGFIYISCVNLLPQIIKSCTNIFTSCLHLMAIGFGVFIMIIIANYE
ncbi:Solute carrier family 39 member 13 [Intoshia linei]|uniref:Solute carrier family 39 member 13 n=1 Tax=Intoshia linei TaxID=1819745 RepID=A0A177BC48_9BILA|nr:Solute carrier family 39 member 13 [Intoshia linei]